MPFNTKPFASKKTAIINGRGMTYIDEGEGDAIVFQHGNPTSSYLWRNIMPYCEALGRVVACDLIGMGDSEKLSPSDRDRYSYAEHREYLFALWDRLKLGNRVTLVLHDWGSALGFDWASKNPDRVAGLAYMEAIVWPLTWSDWPENARRVFQNFRSEAGEELVLEKNIFVERVLPSAIMRKLSEEEMEEYRRPFKSAGEDRRPTLSWPRQIPIDGQPADVVQIVKEYGEWLSKTDVPKLFINAAPGSILVGRQREFCRTWSNQQEVTVEGIHFIQEDSPDKIGQTLANFVRSSVRV